LRAMDGNRAAGVAEIPFSPQDRDLRIELKPN